MPHKKRRRRHASFQLAETHKDLRMLNNEINQLDHLISIGKSDRCGLGFQRKSSKGESVFCISRKN